MSGVAVRTAGVSAICSKLQNTALTSASSMTSSELLIPLSDRIYKADSVAPKCSADHHYERTVTTRSTVTKITRTKELRVQTVAKST